MLYTSMLTGGRRLDGEEEGFVRGRRERVVDVNVDANSPDAAAPVEIQDKAKDEDEDEETSGDDDDDVAVDVAAGEIIPVLLPTL